MRLHDKCSRGPVSDFKFRNIDSKWMGEPKYDLYAEADEPIEALGGYYRMNLRTHEVWNKERKLLGIADYAQLCSFLDKTVCAYVIDHRSYTRTYRSAEENLAALELKKANDLRRRQMEIEEKLRKEREAQQKGSGNTRPAGIKEFPAGYPVMDEFEYIDSHYD